MNTPLAPRDLRRATEAESLALRNIYQELLEAWEHALEHRLDPRKNALPFNRLRCRGITEPVVLRTVYHGHIEHLRPVRSSHKNRPVLEPANSLVLLETSFLALTKAGAEFVDNWLPNVQFSSDDSANERAWDMLRVQPLVPHYDTDSRVLSWGVHVLKTYRQRALNQELVLRAAQELGWAPWFDDPLPPIPHHSSKLRLHYTIKDLNRHQTPYLIHFKGDGTGQRIGWEYH